MQGDDWVFLRRLLIAAGVLVGLVFLWKAGSALLLFFASLVLAALLLALAEPLTRFSPLSRQASVVVAVIFVAVVSGGAVWLFGAQLSSGFSDFVERLSQSWTSAEKKFEGNPLLGHLFGDITRTISGGDMLSTTGWLAKSTLGAIASALIVVFGAIFLALDPEVYRKGLLKLTPSSARGAVDGSLTAAARALQMWLIGEIVLMSLVGVMTGIGLAVLGVPAAWALAILAGLLEFIPFFGPFLSAIPAMVIAFGVSTSLAIWTAALYVMVQLLESNLIVPMVQKKVVSLPPATTIFCVLAAGLLFGVLGILLATPLTVVAYVLISKLWVRDTLKRDIELPGERHRG